MAASGRLGTVIGVLRRRTRRRGFTLIEVLLAAALTAVVVVVLSRWIADLGEAAVSSGDRRGPMTDAAMLTARLRADVDAATTNCNGVPRQAVADFDATSLQLLVANGSGGTEAVTWTFSTTPGQGAVRRSAPVPAGAACDTSAAATSTQKVIDTVLSPAAATFVTAYRADGAQVSAPPVDCEASMCAVATVRIQLTVAGPLDARGDRATMDVDLPLAVPLAGASGGIASAPSTLSATSGGAGTSTVNLTWAGNAIDTNGGAPVLGYDIAWATTTMSGTTRVSCSATTPAFPTTACPGPTPATQTFAWVAPVPGPAAGDTVTFNVAARNAFGTSAPSPSVTAVVP